MANEDVHKEISQLGLVVKRFSLYLISFGCLLGGTLVMFRGMGANVDLSFWWFLGLLGCLGIFLWLAWIDGGLSKRMICPECLQHRPDDDRVKAGMKCRFCAY